MWIYAAGGLSLFRDAPILTTVIEYGKEKNSLHCITSQWDARSTVQTEQAMNRRVMGPGLLVWQQMVFQTSVGQLYVPRVFLFSPVEQDYLNDVLIRDKTTRRDLL